MISVQGPDALLSVYGNESKWIKPPYKPESRGLQLSSVHGKLGLRGTSDRECRKKLARNFSMAGISNAQGVIANCVDTALTVLEIACENDEGKLDILQITRTYAFDVISIALLNSIDFS
jgi:hypothetical protein